MKGAPIASCEKCGQVFPLDQIHLKQTHKCAGLAEPIKHVPKPVPPVRRKPRLPPKPKPRVANRIAESDASEDLTRCERCGRTFPWNEVQLRWKHKCEPTDTPGNPRRRSKSSAADFESKRPTKVTSATIDVLDCRSGIPIGSPAAARHRALHPRLPQK